MVRLRYTPPILILALVALWGCAPSQRHETVQLRDLALHAYDEGMKFVELGNDEVALDRFNRSVFISPSPASYFELGRTYERLDEDGEAVISYLSAVQLAPDYQEARFALLGLGHEIPTESELKADPEAFNEYIEKTINDIDLGRLDALENAPTNPLEQRAVRLEVRRRMNLAAEYRMPTLAEVRASIFPAEGTREEIPSATDPTYASDRAVILNTYAYHFGNGLRYQETRQFEKAISEYENALLAEPDRMEARLNLGDVMLWLERAPQAWHHYTLAMETFPDSSRPLVKVGNYYLKSNQTDVARQYYRQALEKDAGDIEAYNNMAAIAIQERNFEEAFSLLTSAIEIDPEYDFAYLNLGIARFNSGDAEGALEAYRKYVQLGGEREAEVREWIAELEP